MAQNGIKIGILATLIGPLAIMGEDAIRGVQLAVSEAGHALGDASISLVVESTNAIPESASEGARMLIERQGVDFIIGPLSGNEGLAVRDYAKSRPERTFLNGSSANQEMTLRDPAPNFFNFSLDGVQMMAGLGTYVHQMLGYRRVVTVGQDYSYPHAQIGGFMLEFCKLGGKVVKKFWVALGTMDFTGVIQSIPANVDAIFISLAGADIATFLEQYVHLGGRAPLLAGAAVADQTVLSIESLLSKRLIGILSAGPTVDENPTPTWQRFVQAYREKFPDGLPWPSIFAHCYYTNTKAALLALQKVECDLSDEQARFRAALSCLEFECPTRPVKLNHNRQATANIFLKVIAQHFDGMLYTKLVKTIPDVNQTLGLPEAEYLGIGRLTADNPKCD